jgi:hypothetical protein
MEITEDTVVFLRDIRLTADGIKDEIIRLTSETPADPQALENTLDDIASELFRQYQRLQNLCRSEEI